MFAFIDGFIAFAVVFVAPHAPPEGFIVGSDHAAFAASGHDFVLAKTPGGGVADAANGAIFVASTVGLGTVFDHIKIMFSS